MGILIVWGMVVIGAVAMLGAWMLGLPVEWRHGRGLDPGLVALALLAAGVFVDSALRLHARRRR